MRRSGTGLIGRDFECAALGEFVATIERGGESRALLLHGEPGVGKSALLDHLAGLAAGCRVVRVAGVESEMELAFAGLQLLCTPLMDRVDRLEKPHRDALLTVFGLGAGPPPERLLVGMAVLSLLSHVAEERPLLCLVDDHQWLDRASAQVLAFVARRLGAESVGLVLAARTPGGELAGLRELGVRSLAQADAGTLLDSVLTGPIDARIRDQIIAETRGNPLALLELPRGLTVAELAGGFGLPGMVSLAGGIEESLRQRVDSLPEPTRLLLLLAAADPTGDLVLVWRAAAWIGLGTDTAAPAVDAELVEFGNRVRFRHPLARSASYRTASAGERRLAHRALAESTDERLDPDRCAWHRAQAAAGPDEGVAAELELSAARAGERGGLAAAAAFLKRAAMLTLDPALRTTRALAAAHVEIQTGALEGAHDLLAMARSGPLSEVQRADIDLMRARLAFVTNRGGDAPALLLKAAKRLEAVDPELCRATYLDALSAAIFAGRLAAPGSGVLYAARMAASAPRTGTPSASDLLLDALTVYYNQGYAAGLPRLRAALDAFGQGMSAEQELRWLWPASVIAALRAWDYDRWEKLSLRHVQLARDTGMLSELPLALTSRACVLLFAGDLTGVEVLVDEISTVTEATGGGLVPYGAFSLAALRGDEATAKVLIDAALRDAARRGEGVGITFAEWANALLNNGLGRYDRAWAAARRARDFAEDLGALIWLLPEMVEAASRTGETDSAAWACARLEELTVSSDSDWGAGILARSQALLCEGEAAELLHREAVDRLARTPLHVDLARAHLLFGEWLRRGRRRAEAREHLRAAHGIFESRGITGFAERARTELKATGETVRRRAVGSGPAVLTAQESRIARLARDDLSNPEIATRLFISPHTVQYHLRKVYSKLGINSRVQLRDVLPKDPPAGG